MMQFIVTQKGYIVMLNSVAGISVEKSRIMATMLDLETTVELASFWEDKTCWDEMDFLTRAMKQGDTFYNFNEEG